MMQQRTRVRIEKNIIPIEIYLTFRLSYFNPHILQVGIARLTYMVIKHMSIEIIYLE